MWFRNPSRLAWELESHEGLEPRTCTPVTASDQWSHFSTAPSPPSPLLPKPTLQYLAMGCHQAMTWDHWDRWDPFGPRWCSAKQLAVVITKWRFAGSGICGDVPFGLSLRLGCAWTEYYWILLLAIYSISSCLDSNLSQMHRSLISHKSVCILMYHYLSTDTDLILPMYTHRNVYKFNSKSSPIIFGWYSINHPPMVGLWHWVYHIIYIYLIIFVLVISHCIPLSVKWLKSPFLLLKSPFSLVKSPPITIQPTLTPIKSPWNPVKSPFDPGIFIMEPSEVWKIH